MDETSNAYCQIDSASLDADREAVAQAASLLGKRGGRPRGSYGPLSRWLRHQIAEAKQRGESCRNVFRVLSVIEGGSEYEFEISEETASAYLYVLCSDIYGQRVTLEGFRKMWQRT